MNPEASWALSKATVILILHGHYFWRENNKYLSNSWRRAWDSYELFRVGRG
jgi:hypothetical protein